MLAPHGPHVHVPPAAGLPVRAETYMMVALLSLDAISPTTFGMPTP
jgi:hypothetical protein